MNLRDWYYKMLVSQSDMDEAFGWVESAMWELAVDNRMWGIHDGLAVVENAVPDLNVLVSGGSATGKDGDRIYTATPSTLLDCSVDEYGVSTAVAGALNSRILSIFARFVRDAIDPEVDGNGLTVYTHQMEDLEFFVRQGAEGVAPVAPALLSEALLLADITLAFGQVAIQNVDLAVTRREDWLRYLGTTFSLVAGTPYEALIKSVGDGLLVAFDKHVSDTAYPHGGGAISFTFSDTWFGPNPVLGSAPPPTTVAAALNAIVYDLALAGVGPSGSDYIGTTDSGAFPGGFVTPWAAAALQTVLMSLGTDLDAHIGGALPKHPASSIVFSPYLWIAAVSVQAAIQEIVDDLAAATGDTRIGTQAIGGSPESWAGGTLQAILTAIYGHLNTRTERAVNEDISGDWWFNGKVDMTGEHQTMKSRFGGGIPPDATQADICARKTWGTRRTWAHMWEDANIHTCAAQPSDICCAAIGKDTYALAMVPSTATVEIVNTRDITITDVADISVAGAPTPTAICSDGGTVFVMYDNDTVYAWTFGATPGGAAWVSKFGPIALPAGASGAFDRIAVVSDLYIMTANSGLASSTGNCFTRMRISDGTTVLSGIGSMAVSATNYPRGGLASFGTTVYATTYDSAANTELIEIDPATMGSAGHFGGANPAALSGAEDWRDIVCDGYLIWIADSTTVPGKVHVYPAETANTNFLSSAYTWAANQYGRYIVFDGFNIWCTNHTTAAAPNGIELQGIPVCEENWIAGGAGIGMRAAQTWPWANVLTPNPGKMTFDGDAVWCIQDVGTNVICRLPHAPDRC